MQTITKEEKELVSIFLNKYKNFEIKIYFLNHIIQVLYKKEGDIFKKIELNPTISIKSLLDVIEAYLK
ncbi:MAG: hypothetical protein K2I77_01595 [Anaeroplasmataceae bacterium]|nr:hypothetical protein [Anaeroplasmataceae bacterium]